MRSARPPYAAAGNPPPITLPNDVRSGTTPWRAVTARRSHAEAGHHLVEDEQRAVRVAEAAGGVEEPRDRRDEPHVPDDGLGDQAAIWPPYASNASARPRGRCRGLDGLGVDALGTPGLSGVPNVATPLPAATGTSRRDRGSSRRTSRCRRGRVAAREAERRHRRLGARCTRTAAIYSGSASRRRMRRASRPRRGRRGAVPCGRSSAARRASTAGWPCPSIIGPQAPSRST